MQKVESSTSQNPVSIITTATSKQIADMHQTAVAKPHATPDTSHSCIGSLDSRDIVDVKVLSEAASGGKKSVPIWFLSIFTVCLIASSALAAYCRLGSSAHPPKSSNLKEHLLAKSLRGFDGWNTALVQNATYTELSDRAHTLAGGTESKMTENQTLETTLKVATDRSSLVNLSPESIQALAIAISEEERKVIQRQADVEASTAVSLAKQVEMTAVKIENLQRAIMIPFGSRVQAASAKQDPRNSIDELPIDGDPSMYKVDSGVSRGQLRNNSTVTRSGNLIDALFQSMSEDLAQFQNTSTIIQNVQNICESLFKMSNIAPSGSSVSRVCTVTLPPPNPIAGYLLSPSVRPYIKSDFLRKISSRGYDAAALRKPSTLVEFDQLISEIERANDAYCSDLTSKIESQLQEGEQIIATAQSIQNDPPSQQFYLNQVELMRKSLLTSVDRYKSQFTQNFESKRPLLDNGLRLADESTRVQSEINDLVAPSRIGKAVWEENFGPITVTNTDSSLEPPLDLGHYYFLQSTYKNSEGINVQRKELYDLFLMPKEVQSSELTLGKIISMFASITKRDPVDLVFDPKIIQYLGTNEQIFFEKRAVSYRWTYISKDLQDVPSQSAAYIPTDILLCRMMVDYMQGKPLSSYPLIRSALYVYRMNSLPVYVNVFPRSIYVSQTNLMALPAKNYEYKLAG